MKIINHIKLLIVVIVPAILFEGCELGGVELQKPFEYDYEIGMYSNETNMTAWEFIQSRPDLFSMLQEGIEYAGLQGEFEQPDRTYLLLTNTALGSTDASDLSYFTTHTFVNPDDPSVTIIPETLKLYPVEQVKELLLYHIVKGDWTWSNLPSSSTWYDTYASADTAKVNMYLLKDRNPNIVFNNFEGHYKLELKARTSNLKTIGGSYMHVMESWLERPTKIQLGD